jgi:alkylation response protein AidB-like acyl-CoA dehydrogenase
VSAEGVLATAAAEFERRLGNPLEADHPLSWAQAMRRDEQEAFPVDALEFLHRLGIPRLHVPVREGGDLDSFERLYALSRSVSRRDPAVALTAGMQVWSQLVWIAGSPAQKALMRERLLANRYPCLAVSEELHGADLLATEVTAHETSRGIELNGEKWPIGLGARWDVALVLARTDGEAGYRSLSWYLIEKDQVCAGSWSPSPKLRTLGLRAAELAGLSLRGAVLRPDARIGKVGDGLELVLRLFQITRILVCGFALGAADTALRIAVSFAAQRRLHGRYISEIPQLRETLVAAYLDLLAAEALMISAVRGMHFRPDELSVVSLIVKVLVPELTERVIRAASEVLGARYYLREGIAEGVFQKMLRDQAAIGLFDGSTPVCLSGLIPQLARLLEKLRCGIAAGALAVGNAAAGFTHRASGK